MGRVFAPLRPGIEAFTAEERPDLWRRSHEVLDALWPEYNNHGNHTAAYFSILFPQHAHLQVLFVDSGNSRPVARGRMIPFRWDGSLEALPAGIDDLGLRAIAETSPPTAASALAAEVAPEYRGTGMSQLVLEAMATLARAAGFTALVAPVRPNWKDRYPLTPIDRYAGWTRGDGLPFDPWMRVHARMGATVLRPEPKSLQIEAPVDDWQRWTGLSFPEDGDYVFPLGLAPLTVKGEIGSYWEPNVWMLHEL